jgi:protein TonB
MLAAIALSVALHIFLVYGFSLPAPAGPGARAVVIHARLDPQAAPAALPRETARARKPAVNALQSAPVVSPAVVPVAEPPTLQAPAIATNDTQPAAAAGTSTSSPGIPDPVHYPAKDLDIFPHALKPIAPVYPQSARDAQLAGWVTLMVLIDEGGRVVGTSVTDAAPDGVFEQAAQQAVESVAFFPAQKDGRPVRSRVLVRIEFDPALLAAAR